MNRQYCDDRLSGMNALTAQRFISVQTKLFVKAYTCIAFNNQGIRYQCDLIEWGGAAGSVVGL